MNYSFMSFSCPELDMDQIFSVLKLYGYKGFEPRIGAGHRHGIETNAAKSFIREINLKARENRISICCIAGSCNFSNPADSKDNIEYAKHSIELAAEVGSPLIRVFGGYIPDNVDREKSFELIVNALKELSGFAQQRNITVCIETHDSWSDPEAIASIIRSVNHPAIAVNWDVMHPVLFEGYTVEKSFELLKPWIRHVHVHDGVKTENNIVYRPIGEGGIDHKSAIRLLKDSGYSGFISGEWIGWEPYNIHLPRELEAMRVCEKY